MGSRLALVLQLLLLVAIGHLFCAECAIGEDLKGSMTTTASTNPLGGITASLIRRSQYFAHESDVPISREEMVKRDARRSMLRVQSLASKRQLSGTVAISNPAPGTADWETSLSDAAAAEYVMEISLGTPPQSFVAVADTGSDLTWLQCEPCLSCSEGVCASCAKGSGFEPTTSSTYVPLPCSSTSCLFLNGSGSECPVSSAAPTAGCGYGYAYGDGSTTFGNLAEETITLDLVSGGSQAVANFWFGCSTKASSNSSLLESSNGLVGLGRGNISFPSQLGKYFGNTFGYCLVDRSLNPKYVEESPLFFGSDAVPTTTSTGPKLQYTPIIYNKYFSTFYYVGCTGISLGGQDVGTIPASAFKIGTDGTGGIFFDSGTTYSTLSEVILDPLVDALQDQITGYTALSVPLYEFPLCYYIDSWTDWTNDYGKRVPTVGFQFSNTTGFNLAAQNAWVQLNDNVVCFAIQRTTINFNIWGNYQQAGVHVLYDLENLQIGFVRADCQPKITGKAANNSHRRMAGWGSSLVSGLLSLLLLLVLSQ